MIGTNPVVLSVGEKYIAHEKRYWRIEQSKAVVYEFDWMIVLLSEDCFVSAIKGWAKVWEFKAKLSSNNNSRSMNLRVSSQCGSYLYFITKDQSKLYRLDLDDISKMILCNRSTVSTQTKAYQSNFEAISCDESSVYYFTGGGQIYRDEKCLIHTEFRGYQLRAFKRAGLYISTLINETAGTRTIRLFDIWGKYLVKHSASGNDTIQDIDIWTSSQNDLWLLTVLSDGKTSLLHFTGKIFACVLDFPSFSFNHSLFSTPLVLQPSDTDFSIILPTFSQLSAFTFTYINR